MGFLKRAQFPPTSPGLRYDFENGTFLGKWAKFGSDTKMRSESMPCHQQGAGDEMGCRLFCFRTIRGHPSHYVLGIKKSQYPRILDQTWGGYLQQKFWILSQFQDRDVFAQGGDGGSDSTSPQDKPIVSQRILIPFLKLK